MNKNYKVVKYEVTTHHDAVVDEKEPWDNLPAYDTTEERYRVVSADTGEVLDDAQGYGYRTAQKAHAAYAYKTRDRSKDKERASKEKHIRKWMKQNQSFVQMMDELDFQIAKGSMGPDEKFDAKFLKRLLKENNLEPDFTAGDLLKVWRK